MENNIIGKNISELRKAKGVTQEKLAEVVGVTSQAVSKWESGGNPDVELLPAIADFLEVSIDRLFSRSVNDYSNLEKEVAKYIAAFPQQERMKKAFEICWTVEKSLSGNTELEPSIHTILEKDVHDVYSRMLFDSGITLMSLKEGLQYFYIMPESDCGWLKGLSNQQQYLKLFEFLSNADILGALYLLYSRETKPFTPRLLEKGLGITKERANEILKLLFDYQLLSSTELELDDEVQKIYNFHLNPAFIPLLAMGNDLIKWPDYFYFFSNGRERPYLRG